MKGNEKQLSEVISRFHRETEENFKPVDGYGIAKIEDLITDYIDFKINQADYDAKIVGIVLTGSRARGFENEESPIEAIVEYDGEEWKEDMFFLLAEDEYKIADKAVNFMTIRADETGTLETWLPSEEKKLRSDQELLAIENRMRDDKNIYIFKEKTEKFFKPIDRMSASDIEELVTSMSSKLFEEAGYDVRIMDVAICGSRCRGIENDSSDLDVVLEYVGTEREDDVFNLLHEKLLTIGDVEVDINPIRECEWYIRRIS